MPPGDVQHQWAQPDGDRDKVLLALNFVRPMTVSMGLVFDIERQGGLVDAILTSQSLILQTGVPGDRPSTTVGNPRIILDLPRTGFETTWDEWLHQHYTRTFRRRLGLKKKAAAEAADGYIVSWRRLTAFRMSSSNDSATEDKTSEEPTTGP